MIDDLLNKVTHADALTYMRGLPDECAKLIVTSPPYNIRNSTGYGLKYPGSKRWPQIKLQDGYENHNDDMPHEKYVKWQRECLTEMMRICRPDGAIFYNHKWWVQNGLLQDRSDIVAGFPVRQIIIWDRKGGMNFNDHYFVPSYEVIYMICKPDFLLNKGCSGYGDVWRFGPDMKNEHPAPFPIELPDRCIMAGSNEGDIIVDPFAGSGTVPVSAKKNKRLFLACDNSLKWCRKSNERLSIQFLDF